jgi:hypothetical protein
MNQSTKASDRKNTMVGKAAVLLQRTTGCTIRYEKSMIFAELDNNAQLHDVQDVNRAVRDFP